jgi:excisionase family DNA binding protein
MTFSIPPLPGEPLLSVAQVAKRASCSREAIYNAIEHGKIAAVSVGGRIMIAESEADRFIREWPTRNKGVSARWAEFRAWKAGVA